jgi:hypothetical protein
MAWRRVHSLRLEFYFTNLLLFYPVELKIKIERKKYMMLVRVDNLRKWNFNYKTFIEKKVIKNCE